MTMEAPKRALAGGEIDPDLWDAADLNPIRTAAAKVRNFIVRARGGVERTPGTEFFTMAKTDARIRLVPFKRAGGAGYLLEYGPNYLRVHDGDALPDAALVADIVAPFAADDLPFLQSVQSGDVQWLFSGLQVRELRRSLEPVSFALVAADIRNGPFLDQNTNTGLTLTASGETGAVTLTASAALFQSGHVGAYFRLDEPLDVDTKEWTAGKPVAVDDLRRFDRNTYRAATAGTTSVYPPEHEEGTRDDGEGVSWAYRHSGFGIVKVTAFTNATTVTATVIKRLPASTVSGATSRWREGAWSGVRGYPAAGAMYKNSLWAAASEHEPFQLWKSAIDGFNDFEPGTEDDSALTRALADGSTTTIRWMTPGKVLAIGTDGPEWVARPDSENDTVRVRNLVTETATDEGSSDVPGISVAGSTVFLDASRRRLVSMDYDFRREHWAARDLSLLAPHILGVSAVEMVYQRNPWPIFWLLLADGKVAGVTYLPDQDILAWHVHDFGDSVESLAVLAVEGGQRETLFMAVRRNGSMCIERMFDRHRPEIGQKIADSRYLMSAKVYDAAEPATVFAGLEHLEGREVIALVDGNSHPPLTVIGGAVTLNFGGRSVVIGLPVESVYDTLPFDYGMPDEAQRHKTKRMSDLALSFSNTMGGVVQIGTKVQDVFKLGGAPLDAAPALFTGVRKVYPPGSDDKGQLSYRNATAWPATITAIYPEYEV